MADITWVTAEIGGGKSLFAVRTNCKELRNSERAIVNNLPWELEKLIDWCHEKIEKPVDLQKRLRILSPQEVIEFYRYFPPLTGDIEETLRQRAKKMLLAKPQFERVIQEWFADAVAHKDCFAEGCLPMERITGHERPKLSLRQGDGGIFYTLDEVHLSFPARFWQEHGLAVEHYMSQLRKLNDDLMLITQHSGKVDKNFRRNGTEWIVLQNMSKTRLVGGVSLPGRFRAHQFPCEPVKGDNPQSSPWFKLDDEGYKGLYSTMAGVGLIGNVVPESSRRSKGRHWIVWVVILAIFSLFSLFAPTMMTKFFGYALGKFVGTAGKAANAQINKDAPPPARVSSPQSELPVESTNYDNAVFVSTNNTPVFCTGYSWDGIHAMAFLSDGRVADGQDHEIQYFKKHEVKVFGKVFPLAVGVASGPELNLGEQTISQGVVEEREAPKSSDVVQVIRFGRHVDSVPVTQNGFSSRFNQSSSSVIPQNLRNNQIQ